MTEDEWLRCDDLDEMLIWLRKTGRATPRQSRLLAVGCCRQIWHLLADHRSRSAVEVAEQWADGDASDDILIRARTSAVQAINDSDISPINPCACRAAVATATGAGDVGGTREADEVNEAPIHAAHYAAHHAPYHAAVAVTRTVPHRSGFLKGERNPTEGATQAELLRDIFGNPFRPAAFDSAWRIDVALSLARQMYESRDFSPMPILADALQDAGCDNTDILNHCRDASAPHVRGCWVVDLVLEKS